MEISYTIIPCVLGYLMVSTTEKGICAVNLGDREDELEKTAIDRFIQARIKRDDRKHQDWIEPILNFLAGSKSDLNLPLDIQGTTFQKQVWQALQTIPYGATRTYAEMARDLGKPKAARAVGNACGANPTALVIPCHRVLKSDGSLGGYHWGVDRKQQLLRQESNLIRI